MKSVAADPLLRIAAWQRERLRDRRLRLVKGGIEAGNVRQRRYHPQHRLMAATLCGWCNGANGTRCFQFRERFVRR